MAKFMLGWCHVKYIMENVFLGSVTEKDNTTNVSKTAAQEIVWKLEMYSCVTNTIHMHMEVHAHQIFGLSEKILLIISEDVANGGLIILTNKWQFGAITGLNLSTRNMKSR
tara:strand:+ start:3917 stop:4249 length:333 start_codon:yes stop_codon:yes gene_type:complete